MIPVCLRCNDVGKSSAIVMGTSHFLPNDSIENELVKCKHEVVSKALYTHSIVDVVESQNKECVLLKNSSKIHLAACFDGKSYATIVCKLSRSSTKGKCNSCKGVKCGHLTRWNKELGSSLLPDKAANERGDDLEEDSEELDDEEIKVLNRATLKFPLTETMIIQIFMMKKRHLLICPYLDKSAPLMGTNGAMKILLKWIGVSQTR